MRAPDEASRPKQNRMSGRGRTALVLLLGATGVLFLSLRGIARFYTDFLWFDALDLSTVWAGLLRARILLGVLFTAGFFVVMYVNLYVAERMAPRFRTVGPEEELLERYFELVGRRTRLVRLGAALLFALIAGAGVSQQWNSWILFLNRVDFGEVDPQFGLDIGFYVFQLPFLSFLVNWLFAAFIIVLIVTAVAHYLNGGIRLQTPGQRSTGQVKAHLSVLLAILALVKAADYVLRRYELTVSERGVVTGAGYTDINAQLPAINLLVMIMLACCVLFIINIRRRGWVLPVLAVGLWGFVAVAAGTTYPWVIQRFQVEPAESSREEPFIAFNIEATRKAYGLADVDDNPFDASKDLEPADLTTDPGAKATLDNLRLLDPSVVGDVFKEREAEAGWLRFAPELDVGLYEIDGVPTQVLVGARELSPANVPGNSWESTRLLYTHGYGLAMAPVNRVVSQEPEFVMSELPQRIDPDLGLTLNDDRSRLYFGDGLDGYAIVKTGRAEIGFPGDQYRYVGDGGVGIDSLVRQAAFALRFGDINPIISSFIDDDSQILFVRGARERVTKLAPFLHLDSDPYPVVAEGRIVYIVDAYTTSNRYPYAERFNNEEELPNRSGLNHDFNYVRNSVKAVVDAYDGTVDLYLMPGPDGTVDPIAQAYANAFPELFEPAESISDELAGHLRHPSDLFRAQSVMYGRYHVSSPSTFYSQTERWSVSQEPPADATLQAGPIESTNPITGETTILKETRMKPQHVLMALPGDSEPSYVLLRSFVPVSRDDQKRELKAFMSAKSDGSLSVHRMTASDVPGPSLVSSNALADPIISEKVSLLGRNTSKVRFGNLLLVPVNKSIVWVMPVFVAAEGASSVSKLNSVIVSSGAEIVVADTVDDALVKLFSDNPPPQVDTAPTDPDPDPPDDGTPPTSAPPTTPTSRSPALPDPLTIEAITERLVVVFEEADAALAAGDLAIYQARVNEAKMLSAELAELVVEKDEPPSGA